MKYNNEYFSKIFEPLGYSVLARPDKSGWFDLYYNDSSKGFEWFGEFKVHKPSQVVYYEVGFKKDAIAGSPEILVKMISDYNNTRVFPSYCYNPRIRPFGNIQSAFIWYMKTLGYEYPKCNEILGGISYGESTSMILRNMYGETVNRITCYIDDLDDKNMKGSICRHINKGYEWVEIKYEGLNGMMAAINSIIEPEMLISASQAFCVSDKLANERTTGDNIEFFRVDDNTLNVYKQNAKNAIKQGLEKALKSLG